MTNSITLSTDQTQLFNRIMNAQKYLPNAEQQEVIKTVIATNKNIVVSAKAGAGKTTLLKLIAEAISPKKSIALIAFNKSIVKELKERFSMHSNVEIRTSHSLGMKIINSGKVQPALNTDKVKQALEVLAEQWELDRSNEEDAQEIKALAELADKLRFNLTVPRCKLEQLTEDKIEEITEEIYLIADKHDIFCDNITAQRALELVIALRNDFRHVDFVDMIYVPAIADESKGYFRFPKYDFILVDECQDLSAAQRVFIQKCLKSGGRLIFVGDPNQAIYGFAGADSDSFDKLTQIPNTIVMPLNECFRCGKNIIAHVNKTVEKEIRAFSGNVEGEVRSGSVTELQEGDFVMCRATLPLVKLCFYLLARNKAAYIKGKDIGASLASIVKKSKRQSLEAFFSWTNNQLQKLIAKLMKADKYETEETAMQKEIYKNAAERFDILKLIAESKDNVTDCKSLVNAILDMFSDESAGICLSTVHKAKGLEADRCFIIESSKFGGREGQQDWELIQEKNIEYVAYTRAKELLVFITDWNSTDSYPLTERSDNSGENKTDLNKEDTSDIEKVAEKFIGELNNETKCPMTLTIIDKTEFGSSILYDMIDAQGRKVQKLGKINDRYFINSSKVEFFAEVIEHKVKSDGTHITIINRVALEA